MKLRFWGTRGSIAAPGKNTVRYGGNTCCVEITTEVGKKIIIDAGTGIRELGEFMLEQGMEIDIHLLITHKHWDHIQGFPFFDPAYIPTTKISVDGAPGCMKGLSAIFDSKMGDGFFPIKFEDLRAEITHHDRIRKGPVEIGGVRVDSIPLHHPQGSFGFRFREKKQTLVFITDNELTEKAWPGTRPGDLIRFCKDADLLIHDAQFTPEEIDRYTGWGHSDWASAMDLAMKANARELILFHHNPSRKDDEMAIIESQCRELALKNKSDIIVHAAREGYEIQV
jgi:phosphoribosyl 1,2-cyclic phosphodiesterase